MRKPILAFVLVMIEVMSVYGGRFIDQATECYISGDYDCAIKAGLKAIELEGGFDAYFCTGTAYYKKGEPNRAVIYLEKAKELAQDQVEFEAVYNMLGQSYGDIGNIDKALYYLSRHLKIARNLNDKVVIATSLNNIAVIFRDKGDLDKALEYYKESLEYWPTGDLSGLGTIYNNIANVYGHKQDYTNAIAYYKKAMDCTQKGGHYLHVGPIKLNLGNTYRRAKDYQNAEKELLEGLKVVQNAGNKNWEGHGHFYLAKLYQDLGQYKTAKDYCLKAIEIFKEIGVQDGLNEATLLLSSIYASYYRAGEKLKKAKKTLSKKDSIPSWAVHLETYKDKDNAYERRDILRKKGYEVIVKEVEIPQKGMWYRISIGGFKDKQDAYRKREEIKKDFPGAWVAGPR